MGDIGGAIAYFGEAITFIQLAILNCGDHLYINALCGAAIAGIATGAAAIAPYGAAIHAACAENTGAEIATGTLGIKGQIKQDFKDKHKNAFKANFQGIRRLEGLDDMDYYEKLTHVTDKLRAKVKTMRYEDKETSGANINKLVELAEPGLSGASM